MRKPQAPGNCCSALAGGNKSHTVPAPLLLSLQRQVSQYSGGICQNSSNFQQGCKEQHTVLNSLIGFVYAHADTHFQPMYDLENICCLNFIELMNFKTLWFVRVTSDPTVSSTQASICSLLKQTSGKVNEAYAFHLLPPHHLLHFLRRRKSRLCLWWWLKHSGLFQNLILFLMRKTYLKCTQ